MKVSGGLLNYLKELFFSQCWKLARENYFLN